MSQLIGLDFCGTLFERQSLRDLAFFWLTGKPFHEAPRLLRIRPLSRAIQLLFIFGTSHAARDHAIQSYCRTFGSRLDFSMLEKYFRHPEHGTFIASGSALELIEKILGTHQIRCPIIAAPLLVGIKDRWENFVKAPWTGEEKLRRVILRFPKLGDNEKILIFETDSAIDRPLARVSETYIEVSQHERFGSNY